MKTKIIRLNTIETKDDLKYLKYCVDDFWARPFVLRDKPLDFDVNEEIKGLKENAIKNAVNGGKILSTTSKIVHDSINMIMVEEVTIVYEN